ncbi:MAG TPA: PAS domain S-box protein, partial [Chthoniobacterales bacterium]
YKREDLAAGLLRWDQMTPPEFMAASLNASEDFKTAGKTTTYEKQYIRKDGTRWWGLFSASRLTDELGVEFILDVSDRKATEQALAASEARFRSVADNVPQVIWTNAPAGEANYFNRRWYEYTGLSYEESAGPGWQKIVHPDDAVASIERWQEALGTGAIFDVEYRLRGADGGYRWFIGRNVPVRGADGQVISWFGSATDIDDYKQAQQKLAETEERFRVLVEGAHDYAMFLLDTENLITFWSAGAERVFGWSREEAIGQNGEMIFIPEDKAKGEAQKEIDTALGSGRAPDRRFHLRKDGTVFWTDGVLMRLDNADGSLRGFAKVARDASDQRAIEDALRHARDEMEQRVLERTRDLLATNTELERTMTQRQQLEQELLDISEREKRRIGEDLHDMICQELTATALFLKSAAKKIGPEHEGAAATLDESAQIVNRNVGMARDMARGLQPAELTGGTLRQALKSLADQACEGSEIKCHFKAGRGVRVSDDTVALHIYRVTQEAVKNAVKHARAKNILITLDKDKDHVCVSVEDDGKGFNPARRSKGLGLHIMRYRANALGGELK